jgi:hypothetical protein
MALSPWGMYLHGWSIYILLPGWMSLDGQSIYILLLEIETYCLQASCQMNYYSFMRRGFLFCFVNIRYLMCTRALLSNCHLLPYCFSHKVSILSIHFLLYLGTFQLRISLLTYILRPWWVQILYTQISSTLGNLSSIFSNFLYLVSFVYICSRFVFYSTFLRYVANSSYYSYCSFFIISYCWYFLKENTDIVSL